MAGDLFVELGRRELPPAQVGATHALSPARMGRPAAASSAMASRAGSENGSSSKTHNRSTACAMPMLSATWNRRVHQSSRS